VEGYFVIPADQRVSVNGGYESNYPQAQFTFSAEPGAKSKFAANVIWANEGLNGPEKANRTELTGTGDQSVWLIYDNQGREIKANDRVKILTTGQKFDNLPPDSNIEALEVGH
jgi:hypothetical protein